MQLKDFGAKINDIHTFNDLGFVLNERKISFPKLRKNEIEIMGKNGKVDLELINVRRNYDNIIISFILTKIENHAEHNSTRSELTNLFHGKNIEIIFDDEKEFFYKGILEIKESRIEKEIIDIEIEIDAYPYKFSTQKNKEDWQWDEFNFEKEYADDGYYNIQVDGFKEIKIENTGEIVTPVLKIDGNLAIEFENKRFEFSSGTYLVHDIYFEELTILKIIGSGTISFEFERSSF